MDKQKDFEKGWEEYKAKCKKETEELEKDISIDLQGVLRTEIKSLARFLHKLGYRKIPEGAVVLTKEAYENLGIYTETVQEYECDENGQPVLVKKRKAVKKTTNRHC